MSDEAGLPIEPENDPFGFSNAPELKHTTLSAKFMVMYILDTYSFQLSVQDDERPHKPTDGLNLTDEQTNLTAVTSRRGSKVNESIYYWDYNANAISDARTNQYWLKTEPCREYLGHTCHRAY